jgi:ABC-type nitrate/sulfonate/bicarbonate transport system permease component
MAGVNNGVATAARAAPGWVNVLGWGAARWLPVIVLAVAWEGVARSRMVTHFMLPPLSTVLERIWNDAVSGDLFYRLGLTLYRSLTGFFIAGAAGIVLGVLIARSRAVRWFFDPIISVGFPMPKIAFLPIVVLWFGFYDTSKILMVAFDAIFPVVTATIAGTLAVERELIWSARSMGAGERQLLWEIVLPMAFPQILTGLQVALPVALIVCVVAEMAMGGVGLGGAMLTASRFADSPGVFAGIVEIALAGYCVIKGMAMLRRRLLIWHQEAVALTTV